MPSAKRATGPVSTGICSGSRLCLAEEQGQLSEASLEVELNEFEKDDEGSLERRKAGGLYVCILSI